MGAGLFRQQHGRHAANAGIFVCNDRLPTKVDASGAVAFALEVTRGQLTVPFTSGLSANLNAKADLVMAAPSYVFHTPVAGAQAAVSVLIPYGRSKADVDATLIGALGPIGFARAAGASDAVTGFGDIAPMFSLRWNMGVHNVMT